MKKLTVLVLSMMMLTTACSGIKSAARAPVEGAEGGMIASPFAPDEAEACSTIETVKCAYWNFSLQSSYDRCVAHASKRAIEVKASYIYVDDSNVSVGGFKTSAPTATLYNCTNLKADS